MGDNLQELLERVPITGIETDSRAVKPGNLFVALRGEHTDGHRFIDDALARGAAAIVVEEPVDLKGANAAIVRVPDTKRALSILASKFYGNPSHRIDVIGVTGTNGKTTTTRMIAAILNEAGVPCGVIGTVGAEFGGRRWELHHTTPLPHELHYVLAEMLAAGAEAVAMEVSSHALALGRVDDVPFSIAVLTNVTRDHLDFHGSPQAYAAAKRKLFEMSSRVVINVDDELGNQWAIELSREGCEVISYGARDGAILSPTVLHFDKWMSNFKIHYGALPADEPKPSSVDSGKRILGQVYQVNLPGRFNVWNALAAIGVAQFLGLDDKRIALGLASLREVPGRMQRLTGMGIDVVVDYAHTPDALEQALSALRETTKGTLSVVFGCGGDRDRGKRPEMGAIAARLADRIYLTNDNPRSEDPAAIIDEIRAGIGESKPYAVELDRRVAIERAIAEARAGDVVLVAGKGHEDYQILGERVLPFDDATVAREALAMLSTPL